ncbi:MAG: A24 family peptidase [Motiliproteus sp.]
MASMPMLAVSLALVLGLLVGSFLNVVIYRLPVMMNREWTSQCKALLEPEVPCDTNDGLEPFNLAVPNSRCPACGHHIRAYENIPVLSYLFLGGRCSSCKVKISIRYPIVELISGLLSALIAYHFGATPTAVALLLFTWVLIALTMIDYDHQLLPDDLTLPLLWLGLIINSQGILTDLSSAFWGAVFGYLSLWSVYWLFKLITGKEGMGYGDFKLLAALGAWLGWQALPLVVILSSLVGAIIGVILIMLKGRDRSQPIPFGPFLAIAGWIAMLWGEEITNQYWQFIGLG